MTEAAPKPDRIWICESCKHGFLMSVAVETVKTHDALMAALRAASHAEGGKGRVKVPIPELVTETQCLCGHPSVVASTEKGVSGQSRVGMRLRVIKCDGHEAKEGQPK